MTVHRLDDTQDNTAVDEVNPATLRRVLYLGHFMLVSALGLFILLALRFDRPYDDIWQLVLAHVVAGRPGSAGFGLERGFSPWFILYVSCVQDFVIMCYLYPLLVVGYKRLVHLPLIGVRLAQVHAKAWQHHERMAPYGALGIFAFVFLPLFGTGPIVGMLLGYIIGLTTPVTLGSAFAGVAASTAAWIWGYNWLRKYNSDLALWLLAGLFILLVLAAVLFKLRAYLRRRQARRALS